MRALASNGYTDQKSGTMEESCGRYRYGKNTMRKLAEEAGALIKIGRTVRVNFTVMDQYLDDLSGR